MHDDQRASMLIEALLNDSKLKLVDKGTKYLYGTCPGCGKKELYISKEQPWQLRCSRLNNCDYSESTRDRYRDLFENFSKRYPATPENPNATADAYLKENRGFDLVRIQGAYTQTVSRLRKDKDSPVVSCETVRFPLWDGHYWERVLDESKARQIGKKAHFSYGITYKNRGWLPPKMEIVKGDRVFIVEGIFHALAHVHAGFKAIAAFSCNNLPRDLIEATKDIGITWVLAFDDDKAGRDMTLKYTKELRDKNQKFEVALTGSKQDWDDIYRRGELDEKFIEQCIWRGRIFSAPTANKKAYALFCWKRRAHAVFDFRSALYATSVNTKDLNTDCDGDDPASGDFGDQFEKHCAIKRISNCVPEFLYIEKTHDLGGEQKYFFQIEMPRLRDPLLVALPPKSVSDARRFADELLACTPGAIFEGSASDMRYLNREWFYDRSVDYVTTVPFIGYEETTRTYVFNDFGFRNGRELKLTAQGYLDADGSHIKSSLRGLEIVRGEAFDSGFFPDFLKVFDLNGVAALAFFTASLFVRQIKEIYESFPILEVTGEKEAGKSTLIRFLWRMLGRENWEGVDFLSVSEAAKPRYLSQVSNLPVVLLESDRDPGDGQQSRGRTPTQINWDDFKKVTDLDGRVGVRAVKNHGNETNELLFRGSLVVSQNATVVASEALLSRIVHLHCTTAHKRAANAVIADRLKTMRAEHLAGYLRTVLSSETAYLNAFHVAYADHRKEFKAQPELTSQRVLDNHAMVAAACTCLTQFFPALDGALLKQVIGHVRQRAIDRMKRLESDVPMVEEFWQAYDYLNTDVMHIDDQEGERDVVRTTLNHSSDAKLIAINLNHFEEICRKRGQQIAPMALLRQQLSSSRRYPFVEIKKVWSRMEKRVISCWLFLNKSEA